MNDMNVLARHVKHKIMELQNDSKESKATLAKLRRGVGKNIYDSNESWELVLDDLPNQLMGTEYEGRFKASNAEKSIHTTLTLFALHMQGSIFNVHSEEKSFASACGMMRSFTNSPGVKRRFDAIITSSDIDELSYHIRGMIQLLKSHGQTLSFDYVRLSKDLFSYQTYDKNAIMMRWGQDFYSSNKPFDENKEE